MKYDICILASPVSDEGKNVYLTKVLNVLKPISNEIFVIGGDFPKISDKKIHIIKINADLKMESILIRSIKFVLTQLRYSINLLKLSKKINTVIFFNTTTVFPMLLSKLLRKRTFMLAGGTASEFAAKTYDKRLFMVGGIVFPYILRNLESINYALADHIIIDVNIYSENLLHRFGLMKYREKVFFGGTPPMDINSFKLKKLLKNRGDLIGYIGRLSLAKGAMEFAKAIPLILKEKNDLRFLIGGDGVLFDKVENELKENGSYDKVVITGWIPHEKLPYYFNELKLIVVPSYTETIPTVILEAMACGTPIVAAPADAIPDLIKDGLNGFLMENNSPECISKNVIRALNDTRLDEIVKRAHDLIHTEYTYSAVVENYRKLFSKKYN